MEAVNSTLRAQYDARSTDAVRPRPARQERSHVTGQYDADSTTGAGLFFGGNVQYIRHLLRLYKQMPPKKEGIFSKAKKWLGGGKSENLEKLTAKNEKLKAEMADNDEKLRPVYFKEKIMKVIEDKLKGLEEMLEKLSPEQQQTLTEKLLQNFEDIERDISEGVDEVVDEKTKGSEKSGKGSENVTEKKKSKKTKNMVGDDGTFRLFQSLHVNNRDDAMRMRIEESVR